MVNIDHIKSKLRAFALLNNRIWNYFVKLFAKIAGLEETRFEFFRSEISSKQEPLV